MRNTLRKIAGKAEQIPLTKHIAKKAITLLLLIAAFKRGIKIQFRTKTISIFNKNREIILSKNHYVYVYDMIKFFDYYHGAVYAKKNNSYSTVDYSKPSQQQLARSGVSFEFPSLPESDESTKTYLNALKLNYGEVVLDLGAYAGASAFFIAKAVGDNGLVVSLEPDENNFKSLLFNIELHNLRNVITVPKGVWSKTTTLRFQSEGNMGSSVSELISRSTNVILVNVLSLDDAALFANGRKIDAIKMDIEGAELEVLKYAEVFLKKHHLPRLVIEPHLIAGKMNTEEICNILKGYGYITELLYQGVQNWPLIGAKSKV